jgi:glucan 1,3-beta-glucosidase
LSDGNYFITEYPPTFQEYSVDQVLNIKSVADLPVYGDGSTDDTANINSILSQYAGCYVIYFPAGTYIVTDTITVPSGSRIYGDAYGTAISAIGSNYYNPDAPGTMVQIGNAGDVGIAQIVDMIFTVADVLQGCKLVRPENPFTINLPC